MEKMKNVSSFFRMILLLVLFTVVSFSNDMEFLASGEHMIPLELSDIAIRKERISLKKLKDYDMEVNVEFVFDSPDSGKKMIGFITPNDAYFRDKIPYDPDNIKNFRTRVNGREVKIKVEKMQTFINKGKFSSNDKTNYLRNYKDAYAYYFEADFKKGENVVNHSYIYGGISSTVTKREYSYVLTTISRWKNKRVDDFELTVDMGDEFFILPYTFWKDERPVNWEIVGEGRQTGEKGYYSDEISNYQGNAYFKIKNGYVRYKAKNFSPDREFHAIIPARAYTFIHTGNNDDESDTMLNGYKFSDKLMRIGWELDYNSEKAMKEAEKLSDFELEVIRNFPFAVNGYNFTRKDLKDYFSKFFWYYPTTTQINTPKFEYESRTENINEILRRRKK